MGVNSREPTLHCEEVAGIDGTVREGRTDTVTLALRRTGSIEVLVHDDKGRPLAGQPVTLADEDGNQLATQATDRKGRPLFGDLALGWRDRDSNFKRHFARFEAPGRTFVGADADVWLVFVARDGGLSLSPA